MGVWFVDCGWKINTELITEELVPSLTEDQFNPFFTQELMEEDTLTSSDYGENFWFMHVLPTGADTLSGVSRIVCICRSTGKIVFDRIISSN